MKFDFWEWYFSLPSFVRILLVGLCVMITIALVVLFFLWMATNPIALVAVFVFLVWVVPVTYMIYEFIEEECG